MTTPWYGARVLVATPTGQGYDLLIAVPNGADAGKRTINCAVVLATYFTRQKENA